MSRARQAAARPAAGESRAGAPDVTALDTVVHGPLRLGVLTTLQIAGPADFSTLKQRLDTSDGLIGSHLTKLEEAGYISSEKAFANKRPKTTYAITRAGQRALAEYLDAMQRIIDAVAAVKR